MKTVFASVVCFVISIPALAAAPHGGPLPAPQKYYPVPENYFKENHLNSEGIKDMGVTLKGEWSNMDVVRLTYILQEVDKLRPTRDADIREYTYVQMLVFKQGDTAAFQEDYQHYRNPAAIYGGGISESITREFTLSMSTTDEELIAFIAKEMPERLIKDSQRLEGWQKMVARARSGSWCGDLLRALVGSK